MKFALILLGLMCLANAQHDHALHLDTKFIVGEARRVGWLKMEEITRNLQDYIEALRLIESKYAESFEDPAEEDKERLERIWKEHFEPKYRDTHDRIFIMSTVCLDIYDDEACRLPEDIWDDKYDNRGAGFRDDFI